MQAPQEQIVSLVEAAVSPDWYARNHPPLFVAAWGLSPRVWHIGLLWLDPVG